MKEIRDLIEKAEKFLITAEHALKIGDYDSCVSRNYYARPRTFIVGCKPKNRYIHSS